MSIDELFTCLADRGVQLYLDGTQLRFKAPVGAITPTLRDSISRHRTAIVDRLNGRSAGSRQCSYCDWRNWIDEQPKDGRIRTICGKCGKFIGHRPANSKMNGTSLSSSSARANL